ncbi:MAG: hypothetical protein AVDCRST_MAG56-4926, partial [uncultured Cytophagales bacterium]
VIRRKQSRPARPLPDGRTGAVAQAVPVHPGPHAGHALDGHARRTGGLRERVDAALHGPGGRPTAGHGLARRGAPRRPGKGGAGMAARPPGRSAQPDRTALPPGRRGVPVAPAPRDSLPRRARRPGRVGGRQHRHRGPATGRGGPAGERTAPPGPTPAGGRKGIFGAPARKQHRRHPGPRCGGHHYGLEPDAGSPERQKPGPGAGKAGRGNPFPRSHRPGRRGGRLPGTGSRGAGTVHAGPGRGKGPGGTPGHPLRTGRAFCPHRRAVRNHSQTFSPRRRPGDGPAGHRARRDRTGDAGGRPAPAGTDGAAGSPPGRAARPGSRTGTHCRIPAQRAGPAPVCRPAQPAKPPGPHPGNGPRGRAAAEGRRPAQRSHCPEQPHFHQPGSLRAAGLRPAGGPQRLGRQALLAHPAHRAPAGGPRNPAAAGPGTRRVPHRAGPAGQRAAATGGRPGGRAGDPGRQRPLAGGGRRRQGLHRGRTGGAQRGHRHAECPQPGGPAGRPGEPRIHARRGNGRPGISPFLYPL